MTPVSTRARCWPDDAAGDPQRHAVATGYVLPSNAVAGVRIGSPWQAPAIIGYAECAMTPYEFIAKWRASALKERSASQEHFIDLCRLLGEPTPAEADPAGETYCFERGARKDTGGDGWADVWKRHHFAWEYKGQRADLDAAFGQLRQYAAALENPPLLIVSDMLRFRIRTNWTNSVGRTYEFGLDDLADGATRDRLKWAFSDPERLRPGETRQSLTERAAASFATVAQALRERGHDPQGVAHFVNRLVFCMFADDVGLLPGHMFTRMLEQARRTPAHFADLAGDLFRVMARGGRVGFETVDWFNGGLFDDDTALPLEKIRHRCRAGRVEPRLVGNRPVDSRHSVRARTRSRQARPTRRTLHRPRQDHADRRAGGDPSLARPSGRRRRPRSSAELERAEAARSPAARTKRRNEAERRYRAFLNRLRAFTVLDPACGSGNFLYLALQALKDLEHRVQFEAEALGFPRAFPEIGPANVKGIEINPYAAELARVSVWIGEIQWMRRNGFSEARDPILKPLDTIECRDAILTPERHRAGLAGGRCRYREPAVPGRQAPHHAPRRGLRVTDVQDLCRTRARGSRSGLLLVRKGGPADCHRPGVGGPGSSQRTRSAAARTDELSRPRPATAGPVRAEADRAR